MGVGSSQSLPSSTFPSALAATFFPHQSQPIFSFNPSTLIFQRPCKRDMTERSLLWSSSSSFVPLNSGKVDQVETQVGSAVRPMYDFHGIDEELLQRMVYDALVWSSLHGLVVGDRTVKVSGQRLRFGAISIFIFRWLLFGLVPCFLGELRKKIETLIFFPLVCLLRIPKKKELE